MTIFGQYASYYEALYKEKEYGLDCEFVIDCIKKYSLIKTRSILDLGCGTGRHAHILAEHGYDLTGVDQSPSMLEIASSKQPSSGGNVRFVQSDIREVHLGAQFDTVVSLFAVLSYITSNQDLRKVFEVVRTHLKDGGVFVVDFWYGPGVLSDPPTTRSKTVILADGSEIFRIATPSLRENENVVAVTYRVMHCIGNKILSDTTEIHPMRYFFAPELELLGSLSGLELVQLSDYNIGDQPASRNSWCASAVYRAPRA